jgi:proline iminopeptidase
LHLYLHRPEETLALAKQHLLGPISSYAFISQLTADAINRTDITQVLDRIKAKVLIVVGLHDCFCPLLLSDRLHKGIPKSQLATFEERGHFPWLEEPEKFSAILNNFLSS